ncbi:hypothetical protein D3C73_918650 [compost metagenome]
MRREGSQTKPFELSLQLYDACTVEPAAFFHIRLIRQRCQSAGLSQTGSVERFAHLVDQINNLRAGNAVTDAECSQTVDFGERPQHYQIRITFQQLNAVRVRLIRYIFKVSFVQYNHYSGWYCVEERYQRLFRHNRPGRIIRIADPDHLGLVCYPGKHTVKVMSTLYKRHFDRYGAFDIRIALIYGEGLVGHNRLVARQEKGTADQGDDLIGAAAKYDVIILHAEMLSQRRSQICS